MIKVYKNYNFTFILYGCECWCLMLNYEHSSKTFKNKVLWRIYGPKKEEVTGE